MTVIDTRIQQNGLKRIFGPFLFRSVRILKFRNLALGTGRVSGRFHAETPWIPLFLLNYINVEPGFSTICLVSSELGALACTAAFDFGANRLTLSRDWASLLTPSRSQNRIRPLFLLDHNDVEPGFSTICLVSSELGALACTAAFDDRDGFLRRNLRSAFENRQYPGPCNSLQSIVNFVGNWIMFFVE